MKYTWLLIGLVGCSAIAVGAVSAHLPIGDGERDLGAVETAVRYQLAHVVAAALALVLADKAGRVAVLTAWVFLCAIALFSGAIYLKQFASMPLPTPPIGGVGFMLGWLMLGYTGWSAARR